MQEERYDMRFRELKGAILRFVRKHLGGKLYGRLRRYSKSKSDVDEVDVIFSAIGRDTDNNNIMLDVGGHFGESFDQFAACGWKVHCFEPNPENFPRIEERIGSNDVQLFGVAVSDIVEKNRPLFVSDISSGITSFHNFHSSHEPRFAVDTITLADHFLEYGLNEVRFLKIDTEGHDLFVLKGIDWDKVSPDVIVCEFEDAKTKPLGYDYRALGNYLIDQGYEVILSEWHPIVQYGGKHRWNCFKLFPCELEDKGGWGNFIAFRSPKDGKNIMKEVIAISRANGASFANAGEL